MTQLAKHTRVASNHGTDANSKQLTTTNIENITGHRICHPNSPSMRFFSLQSASTQCNVTVIYGSVLLLVQMSVVMATLDSSRSWDTSSLISRLISLACLATDLTIVCLLMDGQRGIKARIKRTKGAVSARWYGALAKLTYLAMWVTALFHSEVLGCHVSR